MTNALQLTLPKLSGVHGKMIPFLMRLPNIIFKLLAQNKFTVDPLARTSMWHDLKQKKCTEVDFIYGAISNRGKRLNIKTPVTDELIKLIKSVENGNDQIGFSAQDLQKRLGL